ncbi:MAG TPA: K(+)-transporting ATPase subunit F [Bryobacterales bacterium]|nr:K(+)-transporting ATPase subunit F [Bryobacterales bacterium]
MRTREADSEPRALGLVKKTGWPRMHANGRQWNLSFSFATGNCFHGRVSKRHLDFFSSLLKEKQMDYVIAGITSLGLFIYLAYALLRPERF